VVGSLERVPEEGLRIKEPKTAHANVNPKWTHLDQLKVTHPGADRERAGGSGRGRGRGGQGRGFPGLVGLPVGRDLEPSGPAAAPERSDAARDVPRRAVLLWRKR